MPEDATSFERIDAVVARLKTRIEAAYFEGRETDAAALHAQLIEVEYDGMDKGEPRDD